MFVIGLTGGIGTGKTQVSEFLRTLGATIINADLVGHEAYLPHTETWREVVKEFGEEILDETENIDRAKLGPIVFGDPERLQALNAIVHPRIYAMIEERIAALDGDARAVVVEAALLIEAKWTPIADEIWVVTAPQEQVLSRLTGRGMSSEQAQARIESQMPQDERTTYADIVINNDSGIDELESSVREIWNSRVSARA